jgi:hypothetical protein
MTKISLAIIILLALFINACGRATVQSEGVLDQITPPVSPQPGMATVVGQVVEVDSGDPLGDVIIRLAEVVREEEGEGEGVFLLNHSSSPGARTDQKGYFVFPDIKPGEYVVVVGEGENMNDYDIIEDGDTGKAKVWNATVDEISDWGVIRAIVMFR